MRKLDRPNKPVELTDEIQENLTKKFKKDPKLSVWNQKYIRESLLQMSDNKCCYCESLVGKGHKEMHIDHFHPKNAYKEEVVTWENLLPSCPNCNKSKSAHDTYTEPIVNPCETDPREYFYMKLCRYIAKDPSIEKIGQRTIDVLGLNDTDEQVIPRFTHAEIIINELDQLSHYLIYNKDAIPNSTQRKNYILRTLRKILKYGIDTSEYGSFMSTIIHEDANYKNIKQQLINLNLWDNELDELHNKSYSIKYATSN